MKGTHIIGGGLAGPRPPCRPLRSPGAVPAGFALYSPATAPGWATLARTALDEGCSRLEWDVLTWNEPALAVYRRLGAITQDEWRIMRLSGEALRALAEA